MHVVAITLAGRSPSAGMPPAKYANMSRKLGSPHIEVSFVSPGGDRDHFVEADCAEDVVSMAECLADHLGGTVEEYMQALILLVKYSGNS
jgi:hypothetical protein